MDELAKRWILLVVVVMAHGIGRGQDVVAAPAKHAYFVQVFDPALSFTLEHLLPKPWADGSAAGAAELAETHRVEDARTPAEVLAAQFDDTHEDVFAYAGTITDASGKPVAFTAASMPVLAAFAVHLRADAALIDGPLKGYFKRLRPYNFDKTLHPVCALNTGFSYPSGHSINGYLYGFLLADLLPEQSDQVLARAQQYARNQVVCGVHYASDTEASRRVAAVVFGYLLGQLKFESELKAVRMEVRTKLGYKDKE